VAARIVDLATLPGRVSTLDRPSRLHEKHLLNLRVTQILRKMSNLTCKTMTPVQVSGHRAVLKHLLSNIYSTVKVDQLTSVPSAGEKNTNQHTLNKPHSIPFRLRTRSCSTKIGGSSLEFVGSNSPAPSHTRRLFVSKPADQNFICREPFAGGMTKAPAPMRSNQQVAGSAAASAYAPSTANPVNTVSYTLRSLLSSASLGKGYTGASVSSSFVQLPPGKYLA
jgi:hypothetical protein